MPGLASTTAAGLARRITPAQWTAVERGLAAVTGRMLDLLPAERAAALAGGPVTIDLDTTDVEVYGRKKRGVAYNHQGQRVGRPHVAAWAETEIVLIQQSSVTSLFGLVAPSAVDWPLSRNQERP